MVAKANYFSHDSDARNDDKIIRLRIEHGAAGYGVYFMLLERLREERNYVSNCDYSKIAYDLRVEADLVQSVVEDYDLFSLTEDGNGFYSESFSARMKIKDDVKSKRAEVGRKGLAKRWGKAIANADETDSKEIPKAKPKPKPKPQKHKYAPCVLMTEDEYNKLVTAHGKEGAEWMITKLDNYKAARGMTYKSDYRAILNWVVKEYERQRTNERTTAYRQSDSDTAKQQRDADFIDYISAKLGGGEVP